MGAIWDMGVWALPVCLSGTVLLLLCAAGNVRGDVPSAAPASEQRLHQAVELYRRGEFDRSRQQLEQLASDELSSQQYARVQLYLGLNEAAAQRMARAESYFERALLQDPALHIEPEQLKTTVVEMLTRLRWRLRGWLSVTTNVTGAQVIVDGKFVGIAPYRAQQSVGRHLVEVRPPPESGDVYSTGRRNIVVAARTEFPLAIPLLLMVPLSRPDRSPPSTEQALSSHGWWTAGRWAWIATAATFVAAATAVGLGVAALNARDRADDLAQTATAARAEDQKRHRDLVDTSEQLVTATNISWGVSAALALGSAALWTWSLW